MPGDRGNPLLAMSNGPVMNLGRRLRTAAGWVRPEPLAAVILWGGVYPGARLGLAEIPPLVFTRDFRFAS